MVDNSDDFDKNEKKKDDEFLVILKFFKENDEIYNEIEEFENLVFKISSKPKKDNFV